MKIFLISLLVLFMSCGIAFAASDAGLTAVIGPVMYFGDLEGDFGALLTSAPSTDVGPFGLDELIVCPAITYNIWSNYKGSHKLYITQTATANGGNITHGSTIVPGFVGKNPDTVLVTATPVDITDTVVFAGGMYNAAGTTNVKLDTGTTAGAGDEVSGTVTITWDPF